MTAIDRQQPQHWEFENLPNLLVTNFILGDCRRDSILERAAIQQCRQFIIVTSDDSINI